MTARELRSLETDSTAVVSHRLRSARTDMPGEENAELLKQLRELHEKLTEVEAKLARESQELADAQERESRAQQEAETERHRAESLEAELRNARLGAEVEKLRELQVLREQFDGERERLRADRERDAIRFDEWRNGMETEKKRLEERFRERDGMSDTSRELPTRDSEEGEHEHEGHVDPSASTEPVAPHEDGTGGIETTPPVNTEPGAHGDSGELVQSMSRLLEVQTQMMAAQANAIAAQSFPPMSSFTGEDSQSDDDNFDRWIEQFEERAKLAGWTEEQRVYQLKAHLEKTALRAFRMLPEGDKGSYSTAVEALKKRFHPVDIEELRSLEFHQLMQEQQSVEQLGIELQALARRAFPESGQKEFDRLVKGRFFQALLPKWQRKLGAPRTTESFSDLYDRARTLERHDKQLSASATARGDGKQKGSKLTPSNRPLTKQDVPRHQDGQGGRPPPRDGSKNPTVSEREAVHGSTKVSGRRCYRCGSPSHFARHCPQRSSNQEAPGRMTTGSASKSASSLGVEATLVPESLTIQQLEQLLTKRRLEEEQHVLTNRADVDAVTTEAEMSRTVGPTLHLEVTVEEQPVTAVVDSGSQATIISRTFLHQVGKRLRRQGHSLPKLELPTVRLYGKGGKEKGKELTISAQTSLTFTADGRVATVPVFIQPDSEVSCLLGMNVLPALGITFLRANGESLLSSDSTPHDPTTAQVRLIQTSYVPTQKGTFLEAMPDRPLPGNGDLVFEPNQEALESVGLKAPEALLTLQSNGHLWIPVQNPLLIPTRLDQNIPLGCVTVVPRSSQSDVDSSTVQPKLADACCLEVVSNCSQSHSTAPERLERLKAELQLRQGDLTQDQFQKLEQLICNNADVFALDDSELGCTSLVQHRIDTGDQPPLKQAVRRVPFVYRNKIAEMVEDMEKQGVIKPSASPWSSPVVLVPKKDGSLRFCIDYRKLNSVTRKDVYPLPRIDDILDTLGETRYFTSLDLAAGYWQIEMEPESRSKSAFVTHRGLHEFVRMPFGLCNAPATFQRLIEVVLAGLIWKCCFAYIDDVLVCSRTLEDHLSHLEQVFARLRQAGLRLKPKKCLFLRDQVPYLGYIVTREGIMPDPGKTDKIQCYPMPADITKVRQFLGLASYYRRFVPGFAKVAAPLHALLKKEAVFHWTEQCQESFNRLKELLVTAPVLAYPQFEAGHCFVLETDASLEGLGAVLAQQQSDGKVHPIAYASRSLNPHERNYGITELETLGLVWAVKIFRAYLLGHHCVVYTDHSACTSLLSARHPSPKLARWAMAVQEMDLDIRHRSGKGNHAADALSRNPVYKVPSSDPSGRVLQVNTEPPTVDVIPDVAFPTIDNEIGRLQRRDEKLAPIFLYLEENILPEDERQARKLALERSRFDVIDGILYYEHPDVPGCWRIAVPQQIRPTLLKEAHSGKFAGHFAERKIYSTLKKKYWWSRMRADIRQHCRSCLTCASRKGPGRSERPSLQPIPVGGPFHRVGVDILQLPLTFNGNQYAVVFMDYFTKWPEVFAVPNQQAETIARLLVEHVISRHGAPELLLSDRGANFLSELVREVCKLVGTVKINTAGYHPQCDGLVEKFNSTIINMLSKCVEKHGRDWDDRLPYLLFAYRVAVQESTQESPFFLLYGRDPRVPTETALNQPTTPYQIEFPDYRAEFVAHLSDAWALAHQNIKLAQVKQKTQYDKHSKPTKLSVGDRVMVYMPGEVRGKAWKLARPYHGPYRVLSLTPTNAEVRLINRPNGKSVFIPLDRVRPCYPEMADTVWTGHHSKRFQKSSKSNPPAKVAKLSDNPVRIGPVTRSMTHRTQGH